MAMGMLSARNGRGRHRRRGRLAEINVTPFVDVMLVLLIVFMITAPLLQTGIELELPRTSAKQLPSETSPLTLSIRADGSIFLQETQIQRSELLGRLQAIGREGYDRRVFIRADAQADYGRVADVLAVMKQAGLTNIGLVTDTLNAPAPAAPERRE